MKRRIRIETVVHESKPINIDSMIGSTTESSWPELYELNKNGAINRPSFVADTMTKRDTDKEFIAEVKPIAKQLYRQSKRTYSQQQYIAHEQALRATGMSKKEAREHAKKERNARITSQRQESIKAGHITIKKERSEQDYIIASKQVMYDAQGKVLHTEYSMLQDYTYRKTRTSKSGGYTSKRYSLGDTHVDLTTPTMTAPSLARRLTGTQDMHSAPDYVYSPDYRRGITDDAHTGRYEVGEACIWRGYDGRHHVTDSMSSKDLADALHRYSILDLQAFFRYCL